MSKCHICDSTEHAFCGFCARCKEHAGFVRDCLHCQEPAFEGERCRKSPTGKHEQDERTEALSECCGASGYAYDDAPEPPDPVDFVSHEQNDSDVAS